MTIKEEKQVGNFYIALIKSKHPRIIIEAQTEDNFGYLAKSYPYESLILAEHHYNGFVSEMVVRDYLVNRKQFVRFCFGPALKKSNPTSKEPSK